MRTLVIGIDGLDYRMVDELDLQAIKQSVYGHFPTIVNPDVGYPVSPQIWGSFLTGKVQKMRYWTRRPALVQAVIDWIPSWVKETAVRNVSLQMFTNTNTSDLDGDTLLDVVPNSKAVEFPLVNYDAQEKMSRVTMGLKKPRGWLQRATEDMFFLSRKINEVVQYGKWDLLLCYRPLLDGVSHFFMRTEPKIVKEAYISMNAQIKKTLSLVDDDVYVIILSDHGFTEDGFHSDQAFWSNNGFWWKPNSITDFYQHIINVVTKID